MKIMILLFLSLLKLAAVKVAVVGGMWPLPSLLAIYTDAKIVYMPKASLNMIEHSIIKDKIPYLKQIQIAQSNENIEELLKLKADVYICHKSNIKLCSALKQAKVKLIELSVNKENYNSKAVLKHWLQSLEPYFDLKEKNEKIINQISKTEAFIKERVQNATKPKALIIQRFNGKNIQIGFFTNYLLEKSGAFNAFKHLFNNAEINTEELYKTDPQIIYISNFTSLSVDEFLNNKAFAHLSAVKNKRVYKFPLATYRPFAPSLDLSVFLLFLASKNHPELFKDIDIQKAYKEHFKQFYNIELSQKELDLIFNPPSEAGKLY